MLRILKFSPDLFLARHTFDIYIIQSQSLLMTDYLLIVWDIRYVRENLIYGRRLLLFGSAHAVFKCIRELFSKTLKTISLIRTSSFNSTFATLFVMQTIWARVTSISYVNS